MALLEERMTNMEKSYEDLRETLNQLNSKMTGILAAVATSAILLAINMLVQGWGP